MNPFISGEELKKLFTDFAKKSNDNLSIIFGAGASHGYSRDKFYTYKPPVVAGLLDIENQVVEQVLDKHPDIKNQRKHIERSIKNFDGDLEAYLTDIYENDSEDDLFPAMLRYLEDLFTTVSLHTDLNDNHYQAFINRVRDLRGPRPWSMLTFNYDTILEQSLESLPRFIPRRSFQNDESYVGLNPKVLKMHGGINFRYVTPHPPEQKNHKVLHGIFSEMMHDKQQIEDYLVIRKTQAFIPDFIGHHVFKDVGGKIAYNFPLMMIPVHTSSRSENSFFERQIELAVKEISYSKLVISVGYKFGDNGFTNALKKNDTEDTVLIIVGSKNTVKNGTESKAYKEAVKVWPKEKVFIFEGQDFGSFVEAIY